MSADISTKTASASSSGRRVALLDELRGVSVFCMVFYHAFFIAGYYFNIHTLYSLYTFFMPVQPFVASLFIAICGISSRLSRSNLRRGLRLAAIAAAISVITIYLCPLFGVCDAQILFGILHLLSVSILLYAGFGPLAENINPAAGVIVCLLLYGLTCGIPDGYIWLPFYTVYLPEQLYTHYYLFPLGLQTADFYSADYFPLLPNLFMFLAGAFAGAYVRDGKIPDWFYKKRASFFDRLGRLALPVYVLHWPVIYVLVLLSVKLAERF